MKKIYLAVIVFLILISAMSCDSNLPYPTDEIKRGVVVDITRITGTDGVLEDGITDGNYKVRLAIPEQQGDYSFLSHIQLLAVLEKEDGSFDSKVIIDNIVDLPVDLDLNMADVYSEFGLTAPSLGETMFFTTNAVLNDGYVVQGWTSVSRFNNMAFVGWRIDGRAYSYNVRYMVACPLVLEDFVGTATVIRDDWLGGSYNVEIAMESDTQLSVTGMLHGAATVPLLLTVDPTDHSVSFPKQILVPSPTWWAGNPYKDFALEGSGVINACEGTISFSTTATVDLGSFGDGVQFIISK